MTRIGFAGTSPWAAEALRRLAARPELDVALVLTQPDRPAGRGRHSAPPAVATAARELELPLLQPDRPAGAHDDLAAAGLSAMALVAYGALVPRALLDLLPWLNLHPSLLPRWRGAAPIERALLAGETELGVAVILLVEALDAGPVAALERFEAGPDATAGEVYDRALALGEEPLVRAIEASASGLLPTVPQVGEATYAAKLTAADRVVDPGAPRRAVHDRVRALSPHVGARLVLGGEPFTLWRTRIGDDVPPVDPGTLAAENGRLWLGCADGPIQVLVLQPPGRKALAADAWLRGVRGGLPAVSPAA